ncbi:DNA polymerase II large subunit DP2 [Candidatus Methanophagaceae archaeon]|jgi:hypothetical protein|nr:DNA polymerase II large subunit DP2 [Methanophagales archaeon]
MATTSIYHSTLKEKLDTELNIALAARKKGLDPAPTSEINITKDLAERVEALIWVNGLGARIRELEQAGNSREEVGTENLL